MKQVVHAEQEFALLIQQAATPPPVVVPYLRLQLNYLYGLDILSASKLAEVASQVMEHGPSVRSIFLIQDEEITSRKPIDALSQRGEVPLFILMPPSLAAEHQTLLSSLPNVFVCDWDQALRPSDTSLQATLGSAFEAQGIVKLPVEIEGMPHDLLQKRLQRRLTHLTTLPTLPEIVVRIMQMLRDPETSAEDLEQVLASDAAIVHRLLQVVHSPMFAGTREDGQWTLTEAIVRLGFKEVGAIAQQIKLINGLVKPEQSPFDLRRFWEHSVGCAVIADRLSTGKLLALGHAVPFDAYWIAALLHDLGKLVLGFFAWEYFAEVLTRMDSHDMWFRQAEERLGHEVTHEYLGRLLLLQANASPELVEAVGSHNLPGSRPSPLVCLVHVANNLCKELGLGYLPSEKAKYRASVLSALQMTQQDMDHLAASLGTDVVAQIRELTEQCL